MLRTFRPTKSSGFEVALLAADAHAEAHVPGAEHLDRLVLLPAGRPASGRSWSSRGCRPRRPWSGCPARRRSSSTGRPAPPCPSASRSSRGCPGASPRRPRGWCRARRRSRGAPRCRESPAAADRRSTSSPGPPGAAAAESPTTKRSTTGFGAVLCVGDPVRRADACGERAHEGRERELVGQTSRLIVMHGPPPQKVVAAARPVLMRLRSETPLAVPASALIRKRVDSSPEENANENYLHRCCSRVAGRVSDRTGRTAAGHRPAAADQGQQDVRRGDFRAGRRQGPRDRVCPRAQARQRARLPHPRSRRLQLGRRHERQRATSTLTASRTRARPPPSGTPATCRRSRRPRTAARRST